MYKLFIVDDEEVVIDGLMSCIEWSEYNIDVIGSATSGKTAYEFIMSNKPDIVITDIRMPGMNGLELIEKVRTENLEILFVIFSGYNEFEYVRKALKLETVDYLSKPVEIDEFTDAICKVIQRYEKNQADKKNKEALEKFRPMLEEKYLIEIVFGNADKNDLTFSFPDCTVMIVDLGINKLDSILNFDINDEIVDIFNKHDIEVYTLKYMNNIILMFSCDTENFCGNNGYKIREIIDKLTCLIYNKYGKTPKYGIGNTYKETFDLKKSYHEAESALDYGRYFGEDVIFYYEAVYWGEEKFDFIASNIVENILFSTDFERVGFNIDQLFEATASIRLHPHELKKICMDIIYLLDYNIENEFNIKLEHILGHRFTPFQIDSLVSMEEIRITILNLLKKVQEYVSLKASTYKSKIIAKIKQYIINNINNQITLNGIGDFIHMNPAYISSVFKEETGENVFDFITSIRVEKAKELIKENRYRIKEITEMVGYKDQRYFCQVFKKYTGITATEYREKCLTDRA